MGGSRSSSSASTSTNTITNDYRVAAADNGIAIGREGTLDTSTSLSDQASINYTTTTTDNGATAAALAANAAAAAEARRTTEAALAVLGETTRQSFDFAGGVSADGFDLAGSVAGESFEAVDAALAGLLAGQETIENASIQANESAFGFAGSVLAGYERASLEESERNFRQVMVAAMVLGGLAIVAWAYVKGR
ncbi:MAG: hypothetical protein RLO01_01850 [Thalassobaculaceae bacterium]